MGDNREIDGWKILSLEVAPLAVCPGESVVISCHEMM